MKLIDADEFAKNLVEAAKDLRTLSTKTIGKALDKTPTVDAVPVIRCKDCKFFGRSKTDLTGYICYFGGYYKDEDDFCSMAEREKDYGNTD